MKESEKCVWPGKGGGGVVIPKQRLCIVKHELRFPIILFFVP